MKALQIETGIIPGDAAANLPTTGPEAEKRTTGFLSMLAERFRESAGDRAHAEFARRAALRQSWRNGSGAALRLRAGRCDCRAPGAHSMRSWCGRRARSCRCRIAQMDPLAVGQKLLVSFVLAGSFLRSESGFDLNWQLLDVASQSVRSGGAIRVASLDLIAVQTEISNEVFAALHGLGAADGIESRAPAERRRNSRPARGSARDGSLPGPVSEEYLAGTRAAQLVHGAHRLPRRSRSRPRAVYERHRRIRDSPPAWSGLGIAELQYVRHGFGGQIHVMHARRAFDEALKLDPASTESQSLSHLHAAVARRKGVGAPRHCQPARRRRQRLERAHGGRHRAARRRHVRRGA